MTVLIFDILWQAMVSLIVLDILELNNQQDISVQLYDAYKNGQAIVSLNGTICQGHKNNNCVINMSYNDQRLTLTSIS